MYDKCYFCLDQLPKLKKESFFVNFGRSRGTKEPTYITVCEKRKVEKEESGRKTESGMQSLPRHLQTLTEVDT